MLQGRVESYGTEAISGWALDTSRLSDDQFVDIYLDNQHCATVRANLPSKTVNGKPCGFKFALVSELKNGREKGELSVRFRGTNKDLANTPRRVTFATTPKRVLVLIPAGARYEHDKVRAHEKPLKEMIETYTNTGDFTVYDSSLKLLAFKDVTPVKMKTFTDKDIDFYNNGGFDYCFLRGSNFINEHTIGGRCRISSRSSRCRSSRLRSARRQNRGASSTCRRRRRRSGACSPTAARPWACAANIPRRC
jgi:hypothetical protein